MSRSSRATVGDAWRVQSFLDRISGGECGVVTLVGSAPAHACGLGAAPQHLLQQSLRVNVSQLCVIGFLRSWADEMGEAFAYLDGEKAGGVTKENLLRALKKCDSSKPLARSREPSS